MKMIALFTMILLFPSTVALADTFTSGTAAVTISLRQEQNANGSKLAIADGSWSGFIGTGVKKGLLYTFAWNDYVSNASTGDLYVNDPAHGAFFVLAFAFQNADNPDCAGGASFYMVIEPREATSISNLGNTIAVTPLFGQICGTKITSVSQSTLTKQ